MADPCRHVPEDPHRPDGGYSTGVGPVLPKSDPDARPVLLGDEGLLPDVDCDGPVIGQNGRPPDPSEL